MLLFCVPVVFIADSSCPNLLSCNWCPTVTTCGRAATALSLIRENGETFDLVISDVYMPDMDGFKLLELIGLELDLPVISKSAVVSKRQPHHSVSLSCALIGLSAQ